MSTGQLFGVAGAAIGFFIGGPSGARMGYMIGSAVGTIVGPQVIEGPSLGDGVTQTAQAGVPRPIVYGTCAVRGNIIDLGPLIKRKRREQQGKGGPVVESERWLRTYAIRICEGPIAGVRRVWRDGKLVYDISDEAQRPEFDLDSWAGVIAQKVWLSMQWERKARFYLGTEDQPIDPALEAIHGVGQTPAYRGTPYMVVELDDITERGGSIPDYLFEVVSSGTVTETTNNLLSGEASELGFDGFFDGFTERVQYQAMPDNGAPIVRLQDFIIERIARIRVVPLYGSVVNLQRAATDADRDVLTQGVVFDSGWFAATEALADEFRSFYTSPPAIQVGAPADTVIRLPRVFTGLFVWVDAWQKVFDVTQFDAQYCDYSGPITFEHAPDVGGALLGSDGDLYWPPWVTPSPSRIIEANMIAASDIVSDICERVGITAGSLDVSQIATIMVRGYPLARQMSAADAVRGLMLPYMFDLPEWDKKLRAIPRGGAVVATITDDDLVDSDEEGVVRKQSLEFPRKLTLTAPDPTANHSPMSQSATRRSELVKAESEASIGMALSFTPDELAQIADMQLKIIWASAEGEAVFMLPEEWTWLTPTDCVTYRSKRYMIYQTECADGVLTARARYDRVSAYQSSAEGAFSQGRPSFQGIRGATRLEVMNLPAMRSEDDDCGLYVAAGGVLSTWDGCEIHVSVDGFQTYAVAATVTDGAVIGWTTSGIGAGVTGFPDDRSLTVSLPDSPESLTYEEMLRYGNLAIIGNEVLQYQDVVDNSDGTYTLTGLVRGGFDTGAPAHPANTRFVLFDSRVLFVPVPRAYIGSTLQVRAVTSGSLPDDSVQIPFEFAECVSQTEWPVVMVDATRDSSDNVTVTWVGRPRLGPETAPYHSRWFTGYRVDFSSGDSFVTFATSLTNYGPSGAPGVPTGATVTVTPTNAITGDGPTSEAITT